MENITPADSIENFSIISNIKIYFSLPINTNSISSGFNFLENEKDTLAGYWKWKEYKNGVYLLDEDLEPGTDYRFSIQTGVIKSMWGDTLPDSLITHVFSTISSDEFGSLAGKIEINEKNKNNIYLTAQPLRNKKNKYTIMVSGNYEFKYDWLPEGKYLLNGYMDLDKNGRWSSGNISPFQFSEPFYFQNDTIRIRKRWDVSSKIFEIPGW